MHVHYTCNIHVPVDVQAIGKHSASRQFLETKVAELEKVKKASNQEIDAKLVTSTFTSDHSHKCIYACKCTCTCTATNVLNVLK